MDDEQYNEDLSKRLRALRDENPFSVPPNYFEHLTDNTWKRMDQQRAGQKVSSINVLGWLKPRGISHWVATAAVTSGLVIASILWFRSGQDASPLDDISEHEIMEYIQNNLDDFDAEQLYKTDLLSMENLSMEDLLGDQLEGGDLIQVKNNLLEEIEIEDIL